LQTQRATRFYCRRGLAQNRANDISSLPSLILKRAQFGLTSVTVKIAGKSKAFDVFQNSFMRCCCRIDQKFRRYLPGRSSSLKRITRTLAIKSALTFGNRRRHQ